ncbi:hypothetical protein [Singulisphaera acidiphila]|uniref:Uncharacterized protein n=1 Tax=Singulisphaera acidiphila (strain ATCC BAA-1392 / DSM 18658 / VKM B-2454 / MOB10) TaxID=886293 RepID=L0DLR0_SINAD|nr:hypothetical protein [Singulisphaera acidiphila]AGA29778.1 hypothetical protein Sinac_5647 [Singulisphaera acidiphila DSM 18658]
MSMFITVDGATVERLTRSKPARLNLKQVRARRNEDWRVDHEVGRFDPVSSRTVKRSVRLIAELAGVPERTVRHGIAEARRVREAIAAYADF